jgi:MerR family transcriptional regulator, heat shock protein HspR
MATGGEWFSAGRTPPPPAGLDDVHWPLYTVGQVAQILGIQPSFLRRLDTQEIVQPARSEGGQRRYSRREISRIEQVVGLVGEGFTLSAIRRVLELQAEVIELERQLAAEQARNGTPEDRP